MRLAVFASGGGSNLQAILDSPDITVALCVSNDDNAQALTRAAAAGVPVVVLNPDSFSCEDAYASALLRELERRRVDALALAGYLKKIPSEVVAAFRGRILNIHPSLLPDFGGKGMYGIHVHRAVLAAGAQRSGATVHFVDEEYDTGPILLQESVPVLPDDTPECLARRVLVVEHRLYPRALRLLRSMIEKTNRG